MANVFLTEITQEGARNVNVKVVGILDTSDLTDEVAINVSDYNMGGTGPTPEQVRVDKVQYSISDNIQVILNWDATTDVPFMALTGRGKFSEKDSGGMSNPTGAGKTGDILLSTKGFTTGTAVFTLNFDLVKQGADV